MSNKTEMWVSYESNRSTGCSDSRLRDRIGNSIGAVDKVCT